MQTNGQQMMQAQVPDGMMPGMTFMANTPSGMVPVQVPPGAAPGQIIQFAAPTTPVVIGTPAQGEGDGAGYGVSKNYRIDQENATIQDFPQWQNLPEDKAQRKVDAVKNGASVAREFPCFPEVRPARDKFWIVPFLLTVAGVIGGAIYYASEINNYYEVDTSGVDENSLGALLGAGLAGAAASLVAAMFFAFLSNKSPACVVYTALFLSPCLIILTGISVMAIGDPIALISGALTVMMGVMLLVCTFCCYRHLIPFMIKLLETISGVMRNNPMMVVVSLLVSIGGIVWSLLCGVFFTGAILANRHHFTNMDDSDTQNMSYAIIFVMVLVFVWGGQVVNTVGHVTYCGVFGRWYYSIDKEAPLRKSFGVAMTTSFGSICFGCFLIAFIRALEAVVSSAKEDAARDGNIVCCIILAILECAISCIGDILEYFSEWAYVQCATRGCSFIDAARITYSMMTAANLQYILQDLLLNSVVSMGALFCGVVGGGVGAGVGAMVSTDCAIAGAVIGLMSGLMAGGSAMSILASGTKAVLTLWAENPEPLEIMRPEIHREFVAHIEGKMQ